jgi:putative ABC transport system permease protein
LIKEFTKLVAIAFIIGSIIAYFTMNQWLGNFAYRIGIDIYSFIIAGFIALGIALLTVSYQAIKAALRNPVDSLRYE